MISAFREAGEKPEPKAKEGEIGNPDQEMRECIWAASESIRH
jgi:hypothetical protein